VDGVTITAMNPPPARSASRNNDSMVLRLDYSGTSFLFTGDLEVPGENALLQGFPRIKSTILKVPHHGSRTSSSADFVEAVHPKVAVISLGYRNRFHFPAPEVVDSYRTNGARVLRTDLDGAVEVDASPQRMSVRSYRNIVTP
jgi:competence protein ComEC